VKAPRKLSPQTKAIVQALAAESGTWRYGYDLVKQTGLQAGTLYPILMRLADRGQIESRWEQAELPGRPPRHMYRLTEEGLALLAADPATTPAKAPKLAAPPARPRLQPRLGDAR
jgi:PadR family transcriptional regulator, regulatory protein PadR